MLSDSLVSRQPLVWLAALFGAGLVLGDGAPDAAARAGLALTLLLLAAAAAALTLPRRMVHAGRLGATLALALSVVALGAARIQQQQRLDARDVAHLARLAAPVALHAHVEGIPRRSYGRVQFVLAASAVAPAGAASDRADAVPDSPTHATGRVWVRADTAGLGGLRAGAAVTVVGVLEGPPRPRNPADFDFGAHLRRRGIQTVVDAEAVVLDAPPSAPVDRLRAALARQAERRVPTPRGRALVGALLLADRSGIAPEARAAFARTGLVHVLAVSGLHVMLLGLAVYGLLGPLLLRLGLGWRAMAWGRAALVLGLLGAYAGVTGGQPPVVRAVVMAAFALGATLAQRPPAGPNALGGAALVVLCADPQALFGVGFQLSFAAVVGILLLEPRIRALVPGADRWEGARRRALVSLTVGLAATLGTAPVLLVHFGRVPLAGVALTPVAVALAACVLLGALLMTATSVLPVLPDAFGAAADAAARALLGLADATDRYASSLAIEGFVETPLALATLLLALATLAGLARPRLRWRLGAATCLAAAASVSSPPRPAGLDVLALDVGHGDALLVSTPSGRHLLVDAGPRSRYGDAGARVVVPHLRRAGIRRLDALVVTHADADHLGGALAVLRALPVRRVLTNGRRAETALYAEFVHVLDSLGLAPRALAAGDTLALDPSVRIRVLGPPPASPERPSLADNDASVVLQLVYGRTRVLLLGDAEAAAEHALVERWRAWLRADVVKVGHHGSRTSSTAALLAATGAPRHAVVSVGRRHGLPHDEPMARWRTAAAHVHSTRDGAVWLRSSGTSVQAIDWRRLSPHARFR